VPALVDPAQRLLASLVRSLDREISLRTAAYTALGLARLDPDRLQPDAQVLLDRSVTQIEAAHRATAGQGWSWFEDSLSYDNARLPQALILGGNALARHGAVTAGLATLEWLSQQCGLGDGDGTLRLPGHQGRHRNEPAPGLGDEQPLDASALVEAELSAFAVTGDPLHGARAKRAFEWFLGRNRLGRPLYDFATGGCCDGLGTDNVNANEGAESTLAFHRAQQAIDAAGIPHVIRVADTVGASA
jgi:hypothetical protein